MSNFSDNNIRTTERRERERQHRDAIGKYFLDLSKLTFAAMVLGVVTPIINGSHYSIIVFYIMFVGIFVTILPAYLGHKILE